MKRFFMMTTAAGALIAGPALAQDMVERLVAEYEARGFEFIEVQRGLTQIKVEATMDGQTIEVIYDSETGDILEYETNLADAEDSARSGLEISSRNRDFTDDDDDDDDDDEGGDDDDGDDGDDSSDDDEDDSDDDEDDDDDDDDGDDDDSEDEDDDD